MFQFTVLQLYILNYFKQVSSLDMLYESDIYEVTAYSGKNQIQIERVDTVIFSLTLKLKCV
jgi:hypothetical protein